MLYLQVMIAPWLVPTKILFFSLKSSNLEALPTGSNTRRLKRPFFGSMALKMLSSAIILRKNNGPWIRRSEQQKLPSPLEATVPEKLSANWLGSKTLRRCSTFSKPIVSAPVQSFCKQHCISSSGSRPTHTRQSRNLMLTLSVSSNYSSNRRSRFQTLSKRWFI